MASISLINIESVAVGPLQTSVDSGIAFILANFSQSLGVYRKCLIMLFCFALVVLPVVYVFGVVKLVRYLNDEVRIPVSVALCVSSFSSIA